MTKIGKINFLKAGLPTEYYNKVSVFCIPACLGCWEVEFLVCFWISDLKVTAGIFWEWFIGVSGSAKPHRGLVFFLSKKMESPPGSRAFRVSGSAKPHRGLVFFCLKKWNPHRGLGHSGCRKMQNPTGVWCFFCPKNTNYTLWFAISDTLKVQDPPCIFYFFNKKCQLHPVVCYLRHPESQNHTLYLLFF